MIDERCRAFGSGHAQASACRAHTGSRQSGDRGSRTVVHEDVLHFWFEQLEPAQWWRKDHALDATIRARFAELHACAARGELFAWRGTPRGRLAEIIVLDQFSRNLYRGSRDAFACDPLALALAQEAVACGADRALRQAERCFVYMPYMHSESLLVHDVGLALFERNGDASTLEFERRHRSIIARFGRYPHRNVLLGRESTAAETAFLAEPGSSF